MLDVSDGLLLDASRVARASGVVLDLDGERLAPDVDAVAAVVGDRDEALRLVLTGGEDHGLLACFPPGPLPEPFRPLGVVRAGQPAVLLDGREPPADRPGWDSFTAP
jgi:thiamine-monophosphate kinase